MNRLESPVGKVLFETTGWISNPRFSPRGDRIAFLHHPIFYDDMGEVRVVDLQGRGKVLGEKWPRILGLAWAPDATEILFTAGRAQRNLLLAIPEDGKSRVLYTSPADFRLEDVAPDGTVLATEQLERSELGFTADGQEAQSTRTWANWTTFVAKVGDDGSMLFSESMPFAAGVGELPVHHVLSLRPRRPRAGAQVLGRGSSLDLSRDRRWALLLTIDRLQLVAVPTGPGQERSIEAKGLELGGGRWLGDRNRVIVNARGPSDSDYHLFVTPDDGSSFARLSEVAVTGRRVLHVSPDDRWVATLDKDDHLILFSMADASV